MSLLLFERIERLWSGLKSLDRYRRSTTVRQAVGAVINLLQRAFDVAEAIALNCGEVSFQFERGKFLRVILIFARLATQVSIYAGFLALLVTPDREDLIAQFGQFASLPVQERLIQSC